MLIKRSGSCHGASRFVLLSFAWLVGRRLPASFGVGRKPMRLCPGKVRQSVDESRPFGQEGVDLSLGRADAASKSINFISSNFREAPLTQSGGTVPPQVRLAIGARAAAIPHDVVYHSCLGMSSVPKGPCRYMGYT